MKRFFYLFSTKHKGSNKRVRYIRFGKIFYNEWGVFSMFTSNLGEAMPGKTTLRRKKTKRERRGRSLFERLHKLLYLLPFNGCARF
mgnify:CR=1 FL=1